MKLTIQIHALAAAVLFATVAQAADHSGEWTCLSTQLRQNGQPLSTNVNARFTFEAKKEGDVVTLTKLLGHVSVAPIHEEKLIPGKDYYSVFALTELVNNAKFRPQVYKKHYQFKNVDEAASSRLDGGGMNGEWVIDKGIFTKVAEGDFPQALDAHYVFQSGDHIGGTIDFKCATEL